MCLGIWRFTAAVCWECLICRGCENNKGTTVRRDVKVFLSCTGCSQIARNQLFLHITLRKFLSSHSHTYKVAFAKQILCFLLLWIAYIQHQQITYSPYNESSKLVLHSCFHLSHRFSFYYVVVSVCNTHTHETSCVIITSVQKWRLFYITMKSFSSLLKGVKNDKRINLFSLSNVYYSCYE